MPAFLPGSNERALSAHAVAFDQKFDQKNAPRELFDNAGLHVVNSWFALEHYILSKVLDNFTPSLLGSEPKNFHDKLRVYFRLMDDAASARQYHDIGEQKEGEQEPVKQMAVQQLFSYIQAAEKETSKRFSSTAQAAGFMWIMSLVKNPSEKFHTSMVELSQRLPRNGFAFDLFLAPEMDYQIVGSKDEPKYELVKRSDPSSSTAMKQLAQKNAAASQAAASAPVVKNNAATTTQTVKNEVAVSSAASVDNVTPADPKPEVTATQNDANATDVAQASTKPEVTAAQKDASAADAVQASTTPEATAMQAPRKPDAQISRYKFGARRVHPMPAPGQPDAQQQIAAKEAMFKLALQMKLAAAYCYLQLQYDHYALKDRATATDGNNNALLTELFAAHAANIQVLAGHYADSVRPILSNQQHNKSAQALPKLELPHGATSSEAAPVNAAVISANIRAVQCMLEHTEWVRNNARIPGERDQKEKTELDRTCAILTEYVAELEKVYSPLLEVKLATSPRLLATSPSK